jgi:hypothetical protein
VSEQIGDHGAIEGCPSFGGPPALGVELRGNLRTTQPGLMQGEHACHQLRVIAELLKLCHRPHEMGAGAVPADPVDLHGDALAVVDDGNDDPLEELADDGLALGGRGGRRLPQRWNVRRQLADAGALILR